MILNWKSREGSVWMLEWNQRYMKIYCTSTYDSMQIVSFKVTKCTLLLILMEVADHLVYSLEYSYKICSIAKCMTCSAKLVNCGKFMLNSTSVLVRSLEAPIKSFSKVYLCCIGSHNKIKECRYIWVPQNFSTEKNEFSCICNMWDTKVKRRKSWKCYISKIRTKSLYYRRCVRKNKTSELGC